MSAAQKAWAAQGRAEGAGREHDHTMHAEAGGAASLVIPLERDKRAPWSKLLEHAGARSVVLVLFAFALGFTLAPGPESAATNIRLRERLRASNDALNAREGELELTRLEMSRLNLVVANSTRYRIPADLAAKIYDIALAEGIDPKLAYSLVRVESEFTNRAISPKGALGLTQLMPATARFFEPKLQRADLFDPETNLRIGFRFLKELMAKYDGDVDLALHAYNRGPGVVDKVVRRGGNPANGYAAAVLREAR